MICNIVAYLQSLILLVSSVWKQRLNWCRLPQTLTHESCSKRSLFLHRCDICISSHNPALSVGSNLRSFTATLGWWDYTSTDVLSHLPISRWSSLADGYFKIFFDYHLLLMQILQSQTASWTVLVVCWTSNGDAYERKTTKKWEILIERFATKHLDVKKMFSISFECAHCSSIGIPRRESHIFTLLFWVSI